MTIHQLQVAYVMEQDRILVRINTHAAEELRLWLTRRMVIKLFPHMLEATSELVAAQTQIVGHDGADGRALTQFKKQESLLQTDFSTPFDAHATALPIGDTPLLATTVHITPSANGTLRIGFEEKVPGLQGSRRFEVKLGQEMLHGFMHLLESALQQSNWGLTLSAVTLVKDTEAVNTFAAAEPPRYLN